ncbi:lysozyme inhibitor LprI family protein [Lysobacter sp. HA35]
MKRTLFFLGLAMLAGCNAATPPDRQPPAAPVSSEAPRATVEPAPSRESTAVLGLRPQYQKCVDDAAGVVPDTQACIGTEFTYQEQRLKSALERKLHGADAADAMATSDAQDAWRKAIDARCTWNGAEEGQGQRIEANACELEAIAARADELSR